MEERTQRLLAEITAARTETLELAQSLDADQGELPTANPGWSIKDVLAHLSSIEARLRAMWQHALEGRPWPAEDSSVDAYNARCVAERRGWPLARVVEELRQSGEETRRFLERLGSDDLDRPFDHPTRGRVTIETLVQIIPRHLRAHTDEIRAALAEYGAARR